MIWNPSPRSSPGNPIPTSLMARRGHHGNTAPRPGDGADKLNQTANSTSATDLRNLLDTLEGENRKGMEIVDLQLDITVTVTKKRRELCLHADL